ncbi:MAG: hypothetical protein KGP29_00165 [Proteobacteria bacterium]|nr:hypothetical protein [Pseudomonadota bacterium]
MTVVSHLYLLVFLPLIAAVVCQIVPKNRFPFWLTISCCLVLFALTASLLPQILTYKNIGNDFNLSLLSIALEFRIDVLGYFFLLLMIFLKIVILLFYNSDIEKLLDEKNRRTFYSVFLINLFGLVNIFTTNNLFNLFVFLEIYAFSFFAISSLSRDQELLKISFRDFCLNAAASLLILFCFLITYLVFKRSSFDQIMTDTNMFLGSSLLLPSVMLIFLAVSFLVKFFPFWLFFSKMKSSNLIANFLIGESMFIKGAVGFFLMLKFVYFFFGTVFLFDVLNLSYPIIFIAITLITFSAIGIYQQKHLQSISAYLCLSNLGFVLAAIGLSSSESLRSVFFYALNFSLVNLFIFIFATFMKRHFDSSSFAKISLIKRDYPALALPLKVLIFFIAAFPLTPLFFANWHMTHASLNPGFESSILIGLVAANFAYLELATRFIDAIFVEDDSIQKTKQSISFKNYRFYFLSFWLLLFVIGGSAFLAVFVNNLSKDFASYLLSV